MVTSHYIANLEKVQIRATKLIKEIKYLSYMDRLKYLKLPTLKYRRVRGDMILVYKLISGVYDSKIACKFNKPTNYVTRGHHFRLFKLHIRYELRKYFFGNRIVSIWNSLPDYVVDSNSISIFENRLDHFWCNQACYYDYTADIAGTGSRSLQSI